MYKIGIAAVLSALVAGGGVAQVLDARLNEAVEMLPLASGVRLETTIYRPDGDGPFPVALISHPHFLGRPQDQNRFRAAVLASYFLQRGFAVAVPMRRGFSRSEGDPAIRGLATVGASGGWLTANGAPLQLGCDLEANVRAQADDLAGVVAALKEIPWADTRRIVALGDTQGGMASLALGASKLPGLRAIVNVSGIAGSGSCGGWEHALAEEAGRLGRENPVPTLWINSGNPRFEQMRLSYVAAGGQAMQVTRDHPAVPVSQLFVSPEGVRLWEHPLTEFLRSTGLPYEPQQQHVRFAVEFSAPVAPPSGFAAIKEIDKVPYLKWYGSGRPGYRAFLNAPKPRAFAIAPSGAWGSAWGGEAPAERALEYCGKHAKDAPCKLYAVDDDVVWRE